MYSSLKIILTAIIIALVPIMALADDGEVEKKTGGGTPVPILPPPPIPPGNKLKAPSRQSVECYYDGESLYLSFAYSEGACILTVTDNLTLTEDDYAFDSSVPATINIGYVSDASLTITTSLGQTYSGEIQ